MWEKNPWALCALHRVPGPQEVSTVWLAFARRVFSVAYLEASAFHLSDAFSAAFRSASQYQAKRRLVICSCLARYAWAVSESPSACVKGGEKMYRAGGSIAA